MPNGWADIQMDGWTPKIEKLRLKNYVGLF